MKSFRITENTLIILAGFLLLVLVGIGITPSGISRSKKPASVERRLSSENSPTRNLGAQELGDLSLEDLGLNTHSKTRHYSLEVITQAEDPEYWEIEHLDGNFYRVRREDADDGFYGRYEFDVEEPIGDVTELYNYAKRHGIIPY